MSGSLLEDSESLADFYRGLTHSCGRKRDPEFPTLPSDLLSDVKARCQRKENVFRTVDRNGCLKKSFPLLAAGLAGLAFQGFGPFPGIL